METFITKSASWARSAANSGAIPTRTFAPDSTPAGGRCSADLTAAQLGERRACGSCVRGLHWLPRNSRRIASPTSCSTAAVKTAVVTTRWADRRDRRCLRMVFPGHRAAQPFGGLGLGQFPVLLEPVEPREGRQDKHRSEEHDAQLGLERRGWRACRGEAQLAGQHPRVLRDSPAGDDASHCDRRGHPDQLRARQVDQGQRRDPCGDGDRDQRKRRTEQPVEDIRRTPVYEHHIGRPERPGDQAGGDCPTGEVAHQLRLPRRSESATRYTAPM